MTSETELFGRDSIKLNILREIKSGDINISLSLNGGVYQDYLSQIHRDGSRMQVLGKFNLSEDPSGDVLTVRPIAVSGMLRITFGFSGNPFENEKKLRIFRSATKSVEREYDVSDMLSSVEFIPQGNVKYLLRLTYGEPDSDAQQAYAAQGIPSGDAPLPDQSLDGFDMPASSDPAPAPTEAPPAAEPKSDPELERIQAECAAAEEKLRKLRERRQSAHDILKKLEAEYEKDYDEFQRELEEYKQQYGVDQTVIEYYRDNDIRPVEELMKEISDMLEQAEKQISLVILGRQKKTREIENEVKSNKRQ